MLHSIVAGVLLISAHGWAWSPTDPAQTISVSTAHYDANTEVQYYDLGLNTNHSVEDPTAPNDNPVWVLVRGFQPNTTRPILVDGQLPIFGIVPGMDGYSDIRRISWVQVDANYVADTWTALDQIAGNVSIFQTPQIFVNMALVPNGTTLQGSSPFPVRLGYHRGQKVSFVSAGVTLPILSPSYVFFKPGSSTPSGRPVVSTMPGHVNYTGFYDVHYVSVPADYVDDSIKSVADAVKFPHKSSGMIANWPIILLSNGDLNVTAAPSPGDPSRSPEPQSSGAATTAPSGSGSSGSGAGSSGPTKSAAVALSMAIPGLVALVAYAFI